MKNDFLNELWHASVHEKVNHNGKMYEMDT